MATDVQVETVVARPRLEVAAYASDPAHDPEWIGALRTARVLTPGPVAIGSQVERVGRFLGRRLRYVNEVTAFERGERLAMRSVQAPFPMRVTYTWEDAPAGTRMRIHAQGDAGRFAWLAGPLLDRIVRRSIAADLARLRTTLEARAAS
jgi:hypothetical protein